MDHTGVTKRISLHGGDIVICIDIAALSSSMFFTRFGEGRGPLWQHNVICTRTEKAFHSRCQALRWRTG